MRIASHAARVPALPANEKKYDWKGATVRALKTDQGLDSSAIPAKALKKIGDWTDTTFTYSKALIGKETVYVHVDDMLAAQNMDEGFIAATANGVVVASGSFKLDAKGNFDPASIRFDKKPSGL